MKVLWWWALKRGPPSLTHGFSGSVTAPCNLLPFLISWVAVLLEAPLQNLNVVGSEHKALPLWVTREVLAQVQVVHQLLWCWTIGQQYGIDCRCCNIETSL